MPQFIDDPMSDWINERLQAEAAPTLTWPEFIALPWLAGGSRSETLASEWGTARYCKIVRLVEEYVALRHT